MQMSTDMEQAHPDCHDHSWAMVRPDSRTVEHDRPGRVTHSPPIPTQGMQSMPETNPPSGEPFRNLDELRRLINPASTPEYEERFAELMEGIVPLAELLQPARAEPPALPPPQPVPQPVPDNALAALLRVYTNGVADERLRQAAQVLADDTVTAHEKLTKIDGLMPLPPTASAEQLGAMLGVSKQAVMKTLWWCKNRRGMTDEEIDRRQARLTDRGRKYERPRSEEDEDER
ncbi:MAG: hypothetical protein SNJ75_10225 [Gemmataceae bacterium]